MAHEIYGKPLVVDSMTQKVATGSYMKYLEDSEGKLDIRSFLDRVNEQKMTQSVRDQMTFGYTQSAYWFMIDFNYSGKSPKKFYLEIPRPQTDEIDFYTIVEGQNMLHKKVGDFRPFFERLVQHRNFLLPITLQPEKRTRLVFRIKTSSAMKISAILNEADSFWESDAKETLILGIYFGILFVMAIYNGFICITLRSRTYFYYVLYVSCALLIVICINGYDYQYLWPENTFLRSKMIPLLITGNLWPLIYFSIYFLDMKNTMPRTALFLKALAWCYILMLPVSFFGPVSFSMSIFMPLILITCTALWSSGFLLLINKSVEAKYFLIALTAYFIGTSLKAAVNIDLVPSNVVTEYSMQIGSALEVILLSLALARNIKRLQEEKIEIQQHAAESLQEKVDERTLELSLKTDEAEKAKDEAEKAKDEAEKAREEAEEAHKETEILRQKAESQAVQLQALDRHKTAFFQNMSHELRTPLTLILNPMENQILLQPDNKDLQVATNNARRLLRLVNQLLDFQKLQAGKHDLRLSPLNINRLTHVCGEYFHSACKNKNISFLITKQGEPIKPEDDAVWINGEVDAIEKIIFNYLSNALKYTPQKGRIELGLKIEGERIQLFVQDSGVGVSEDAKTRLFKVFSQADESTIRAYESSGLGLALVKSLSEQMGGEVGIESEIGKGSLFWVDFPIIPKAEIEEMAPYCLIDGDFEVKSWLLDGQEGTAGEDRIKDEEVTFAGQGTKVLVIDDLVDMRNIIAESLLKHNYSVMTANNGLRGLEAAKKYNPDVIITDWMMPEMSGPEFIKKIKRDDELNSIPVVLLSAKTDEESKIIGTEIGADAFLGKPFNEQELVSVVFNLSQLMASAKRELHHTKNLLTQAEKLSQLGDMISSIAHEINNPILLISVEIFNGMRALNSMEEQLKHLINLEEESNAEVYDAFSQKIARVRRSNEMIEVGSDRLKELSVALRTQSRMEVTPTKDVNLSEVIKESMLIAGARINRFKVDKELPEMAKINCYRSRIGQVITNILVNAADAIIERSETAQESSSSSFQGHITIKCIRADKNNQKGFEIIITDNGTGIPEDIQDTIFDRFYTSKQAGKGTGLGLTLSAEIVKDHGGRITINNENAAEGACFILWLPVEMPKTDHGYHAAS